MHAIWKFLLTDEFIHAYKYGIVIKCIDGIERRVYPRLFTYSADYPEKCVLYQYFAHTLMFVPRVLLATIRDKGLCPCPRCFIPKSSLDRLGADLRFRISKARYYLVASVRQARKFIYEQGLPIGGKNVQDLLKESSSVPTEVCFYYLYSATTSLIMVSFQNAFVNRLGLEFSVSKMLVVDLLHEFEIGVWKMIFTHLIRLLYSCKDGEQLVEELNRRYAHFLVLASS